MIIDFQREMSDIEYDRYTNMLGRHTDKKWLNDEFREEMSVYFNLAVTVDQMVYSDEEDYLEELQRKVSQCVASFSKKGYVGHGSMLSPDPIFWAERQNMQYVVIYDVIQYDNYWMMFKDTGDYKEYQARFHGEFGGGISLLKRGWIKERFMSTEATIWARTELGDDFLYDHKVQVYYFKPEAAMAFKLVWTE